MYVGFNTRSKVILLNPYNIPAISLQYSNSLSYRPLSYLQAVADLEHEHVAARRREHVGEVAAELEVSGMGEIAAVLVQTRYRVEPGLNS